MAVRQRARERVESASASAGHHRTLLEQGATFYDTVLDALRKSADSGSGPLAVPVELFLAFPERFFSRWHHVAYGEQRNKSSQPVSEVSAPAEAMRQWDILYRPDTHFSNFVGDVPRHVLIAHGLSPISDSVLLLADIGRAARVSLALDHNDGLQVMLADVSWMSYNRSVRRFAIPDERLSFGLKSCLDQRQRLYKALKIDFTLHEIKSYPERNSINSEKLKLIAEKYRALVEMLWGRDVWTPHGPHDHDDPTVKARDISKQIREPLSSSNLDPSSPLRALTAFPNGLESLEVALKPHLDVLREIVSRFQVLSDDTMYYFFAQYYAQQQYRGKCLKICPTSERNFDEPFDKLDATIRTWGEAHQTAIQRNTKVGSRKPRMMAVYMPQYRLNGWNLLPYTPLSLDATRQSSHDVDQVIDRVIMLTDRDEQALDKIRKIVRQTATRPTDLNRIVFDIIWFMIWCARHDLADVIERACKARGLSSREALFDGILAGLGKTVAIESDRATRIGKAWERWLRSLDGETQPSYVPSHIQVASMTAQDWTEGALDAATILIAVANEAVRQLT